MPREMKAQFSGQIGFLTWFLPPEAVAVLGQASPHIQSQILEAFSNNLGVFCAALLSAFGNDAKVEVLGMIIQELKELADQ